MHISFGKNLDLELAEIRRTQRTILRLLALNTEVDMATNDELAGIRASLQEASTEIPAKLDALLAQVGDQADPALVEEIKGLAGGLANIVPNADPEPAPVDPEVTPDAAPE